MKQFLLALILIAVPVGLFSGVMVYQSRHAAPVAPLGDMSAFKAIVTDVQAIAAKGDFVAAEKRVTDFESLWDDKEEALRPMNADAWGNIDDAADKTFSALRADAPDAAKVTATLANLQATLDDPLKTGTATAASGPQMVNGVAVTDNNGHPIPCETMLTTLRQAMAAAKLDDARKAQVDDLMGKATERCNADDDTRADGFSAQAIALAGH